MFPTFVGPPEGSEDLAVLGGPASICLNLLASICLNHAAVVLLPLAQTSLWPDFKCSA